MTRQEDFSKNASAKRAPDSFERADKLNKKVPVIKCGYCQNTFSASTYQKTVEIYKRHLEKKHNIFD